MYKKSLAQHMKLLRRLATKAEKEEIRVKVLIELLALLKELEKESNQIKDG